MRPTHLHYRPPELDTEESFARVNHIYVAANLLDQMICELRSLAMSNQEFARLWLDCESDALVGLWTLHEIVYSLMRGDDPSVAQQLMQQATALIYWLSANVDELTLCALGDVSPVDVLPPHLH